MAGQKNNPQDDVRFRVLRLLEQNPEMSQRDLAQAVGISTGSVHYVLKALVDKGLVKLGNFTASEDKRRYAYVLTPKGISEKAALTRRFLIRKMTEYEMLKTEIEEVGRDISDRELAELKNSDR
ncbi:MarR family EPS-associated transcriptional regulator [Sulfitobacter sp. HI0040]|jgi:EPS-associated MarR family transcriptional regulator|nr:MarR family EPS-associated transcriptional regulator [Sulfitobacter sp. HI0023]KZY26362.1 MarR family EPS-associated transcriptional regulator [Sulfitobacter sp. HI0040]KZZ68336.1 MarR family EPS-associated transcriptional regulator [Sulfitobacter sp. HI0129]